MLSLKKFLRNVFFIQEKVIPLHPQNSKETYNGALVQLVRMPACHAGGHEFESRTHRFSKTGEQSKHYGLVR